MRAATSVKAKFNGAIAATAVTAAAVASAALGSAPTAAATCASFFGIGGGANCSSTLTTVAVALGKNAEAHAAGVAGAALALGNSAFSVVQGGGFSFGVAAGTESIAVGGGFFSVATALGPRTTAATDGAPGLTDAGLFNIAVNLSPFNKTLYPVVAGGIGNVAVNLFGSNDGVQVDPEVLSAGLVSIAANIGGKRNSLAARGKFLNTAITLFGRGNNVSNDGGGFFNTALEVFGTENSVAAGPGPLALAASLFQSGKVIVKEKPGVNINGFKIPKTAAATEAKAPRRPASTHRSARSAATHRSATAKG